MINPQVWVSRSHRGPRATPLPLTAEQREVIEAAIRPATAEKRVVKRGEGLLLMASGVSIRDTAKAVGVNPRTAFEWRQRVLEAKESSDILADAPRSGRPSSLSRMLTQHELRAKRVDRRRTSGFR